MTSSSGSLTATAGSSHSYTASFMDSSVQVDFSKTKVCSKYFSEGGRKSLGHKPWRYLKFLQLWLPLPRPPIAGQGGSPMWAPRRLASSSSNNSGVARRTRQGRMKAEDWREK
ncbi:hypothetical protein GUJ93_ZPchr0015g6765 [Zizania palustris]|uniref:Uncharacterized protein n=1 Tax=Zizania palustris TaxID=103762 RepID=A0A8J5TM09_ZIZPA|nr:hypothetical protein GUJ93_ZPchr0015g6765 [Zizania palustris]